MKSYNIYSKIVYSDASHSGYAGYEVQSTTNIAHGQWSPLESAQSSTWRELKAVYNVLLSLGNYLEHSRIKWFTDKTSVFSIDEKGLMKRELQKVAIEIFSFCTVNWISLEIEWLPRTFFNTVECDDWGLSVKLFNMLNGIWGPFTTDWFASEHNAKIGRPPVLFILAIFQFLAHAVLARWFFHALGQRYTRSSES